MTYSMASSVSPLCGGVGIGVHGNHRVGTLGGFLEDEDGNCYILSAAHVLNPKGTDSINEPVHFAGTSEQSSTDVKGVDNNRLNQESTAKEIIIELPARSDYDSMLDGALQKLRLLKREKRILTEINRQKEEINVKGLDQFMEIDRDIATAEAHLEDIMAHKPREVGKYLFGLRQNVHMDDQNCWHFVDAGIAELNEDERKLMMLSKDQEDPMNRCPVYGFENNGDFRPNGKIVSSENFGKLLQEKREFSKIGEKTGFTREGFFWERNSDLYRNFLFRSTPEFLRPSLYPVGNPSEESCQLLTCKDKDDVESGVSLPWGQNCFVIDKRREPFCESGDSGAIVFDDEGLAWGMIVGTFDQMGNTLMCIVSPLWVALKALEQKYGIKGLKLWCVNELENRLLDDKKYRARFVEKHRKMAKQLRDNEILKAQLQTKIVEQQTKLRNRTNKNEILTNNSVGDRLHYLKNRAITSENLVNEDEGTHGSLKKTKKHNQERPAELAGFRNCYNCPVSCVSSVVSFIFFSMGLPVCFKKFERGMQNSFNTLSRVCEEEFEVGDCSLAFKDFHDMSIIEKEHKISLVITDADKADHHLERAIEIMKGEQHPALFIMHYKSDTGRAGHCLAIMPDSKFVDVQQEYYWNPQNDPHWKSVSKIEVWKVKEQVAEEFGEECSLKKCGNECMRRTPNHSEAAN